MRTSFVVIMVCCFLPYYQGGCLFGLALRRSHRFFTSTSVAAALLLYSHTVSRWIEIYCIHANTDVRKCAFLMCCIIQ